MGSRSDFTPYHDVLPAPPTPGGRVTPARGCGGVGVMSSDRDPTMVQLYLRQGPWCQCERSCNAATGEREAGVSCYEVSSEGGGRWAGTGEAFEKRRRAFRSTPHLIGVGSAWFLVSGVE